MKPWSSKMEDITRGLRLFFVFRLVAVTTLMGLDVFFRTEGGESLVSPGLITTYVLMILVYLFTIGSSLVLPWLVQSKIFIYTQFIWEVIFATVMVAITGGVRSLFILFYFLAILNAAAHSGKRGGALIAALCSISYGALLLVQQYNGTFLFFGDLFADEAIYPIKHYIQSFLVQLLAFSLVAWLGGYLAEELRSKREALEKQESSLQELRALHRQIVENVSAGLMTIDLLGKIVDWNRAASEITGLEGNRVRGKPYGEFLPGFKTYLEPIREGKKKVPRNEARIAVPKGERHIGFSISPLYVDQEVKGHVVAFQDLTEVKQMEQEMYRREQLAAVGELAASIAHEIRNPLTAISGSIQVLRQGLKVKGDHAKLMDIVLRESDRLNQLITDFLTYSRSSERKEKVFNLGLVAKETVQIFRTGIDKGSAPIQIETDLNEKLPLKGDEQQMRQVLWNLLVNAKQAMLTGGTLRVQLRPYLGRDLGRDLGGDLGGDSRESWNSEEWIELSIQDTGKGIPKEALPKIFHPFFTTKEGGTGLGLSIVYRVVESHGGTIHVTSEVGKGTQVTIRLPRREVSHD
ncbi:MAG: PAS domain S-box protein [Deltaproteobacteria bacterium]|nr:PAS domain S-box protein [Deltaproteobacteria bacterium]